MSEHKNGNNRGQSEMPEQLINLTGGRAVVVREVLAKAQNRRGDEPLVATREVQFARLSCGGLVDLVRRPSGSLSLIIYRNGTATIRDDFWDGERTLIPPRIDRGLVGSVRWPTSLGNNNDTPRWLLNEVEQVVRQHVDLDDPDYNLVAHFSLYTWFSDVGNVAPYLWLVGPYQGGKTTLLRLLSALCRRAILVADMTPAALYRVCDSVRPTLLLDELDLDGTIRSRETGRLLRSGSSRGGRVLRKDKAYDLFGPKVIVSRQEPSDAALASRALIVAMRPSDRDRPPLDEALLDEIAARLQPRLFAFRLRNYSQVKSPQFTADRLTPRMRDIARALAIPCLGNAELESVVVDTLRPQDAQAKLKRSGEPEWVVATALYTLCHRATNYWTVNEITSEVRDVLGNSGESYQLAPRKVGDILRSLGFATEKLGNQGRGMRVTRDLLRKIHKIAKTLGLCRADILNPQAVFGGYGRKRCELCKEFGLSQDHRGSPLRDAPAAQRTGTGLYGSDRNKSERRERREWKTNVDPGRPATGKAIDSKSCP